MPLMHVKVTNAAFNEQQKQQIVEVLTNAACTAESVPDTPESRRRALVFLQEMSPGSFFSDCASADNIVAGVFIDWQVSTGVLDGARKERFAKEIQGNIASIYAKKDRLIITSCVIHEVPEGQWAQAGAIRRLPEISSLAGFEHLQAIAEEHGNV